MLETSSLVAHAADLELVIRHVLAGLGHGIHAGRERGAGVEFSEYRAYAPGDEWRRVDWKLLARADRYYVREAERDSHVGVWLWLDATASMAEPSRRVQGLDKFWFARTALGCVAAIAQRQGDAFGLIVCTDGRVEFTPASRGPRQLQRVLAALQRARPAGVLPDADTLRANLHFARSQSMVFAASDVLDWPSPLSEALIRLRHMRHDVRLLALRTEAEVAAQFASGHAYRDPEFATGSAAAAAAALGSGSGAGFESRLHAGLHSFSSDSREAYRSALEAHLSSVRTAARQHDIPLSMAQIEQPLGEVLRGWLRNPR